MSYVYGPVPSRRLGQSLGVDPIPFKVCNYNCDMEITYLWCW